MSGVAYVSCAKGAMYRSGGWYDDPTMLKRLADDDASRHAPEVLEEIFPPYRYDRPAPRLSGGDPHDLAQVATVAASTRQTCSAGPATVLALARDCCVSRSVIYLLRDDETCVVYETHRPNDRAVSQLRHANEVRLVDRYLRHDPFVAYLWIGSAGSMNYGHWLVDDLPRLAAIVALRRARPFARIVIVTPECGVQLDEIHAQTAGAVAATMGIENIDLITVDRDARIFFQELYFVSPPTSHPVLKSPDAMQFVAEHLDAATAPIAEIEAGAPKRLFVERAWTGARDLANQAEISRLLGAHGFVPVETGAISVFQQARLFAGAELVIGCMGASMTNTLFCAPGTPIGYIAPQGWVETFYWDLAAARAQPYAACYGPSTPQQAPAWQKNYRINPAEVLAMLETLEQTRLPPAEPDPVDVFNPFRP